MKLSFRSFILVYLLFEVFSYLDFKNGVNMLYISSRLESGESGANAIQSLYFILTILFQLFIGAVSDIWGRYKVMLFGLCLLPLYAIGMAVGHGYWPILFLTLLQVIGVCCLDANKEAVFYDGLSEYKREGTYERYNTFIFSAGFIALSGATILGGIFFDWYQEAVMYALAIALLLCLASAAILAGNAHAHSTMAENKSVPLGKAAILNHLKSFFSKKSAMPIVLYSVFYGLYEAAIFPLFLNGQLLFNTRGYSSAIVGAIIGFSELGVSVATIGLGFFLSRWSSTAVTRNIIVFSMGASLLVYFFQNTIAIAAFGAIIFFSAFPKIYVLSRIQKIAAPEDRALALSTMEIGNSILVSLGFFVQSNLLKILSGNFIALQAIVFLGLSLIAWMVAEKPQYNFQKA